MKSGFTTASQAVLLTIASWALTVSAASAATDPGVRPVQTPAAGQAATGDPVQGLTQDQTTLFFQGQTNFAEVEMLNDGLGPRFNLDSCKGCHVFPTHGGSSPPLNPQVTVSVMNGAKNVLPPFITANGPIREARFKFLPNGQRDGGVHSLFVIAGRVDPNGGNASGCTAVQEDFAGQFARGNVSTRIPTPTYGLGLVENIPDTTLVANLAANAQQKKALGISGHLNTNPNDGRVTRFGWKAQNVSLLLFAGEAYNVEMGITNEIFQTERDLNPTCQFATTPNSITGANTIASSAILSDIENFALYMRYLGPPIPSTTTPGGAASITNGQQVFNQVGCALCHTPTLMSDNTTVQALGNKSVNLFSDLAVHHMGPGLADNVIQGSAGPDEFRTAPLWGVGQRVFFLHDGRTSDLLQAIALHASGPSSGAGPGGFAEANTAGPDGRGWGGSRPSEANGVIANFNALPDASKQDLLNFLRSL
jgi:Di-haem oxidoreductase, putative peroxidase